MSKSKKRILNRGNTNNSISCSRDEAVNLVVKSIKAHKFDKKSQNLLTLFGISGEELAEAGLTWEELKAISSVLSVI